MMGKENGEKKKMGKENKGERKGARRRRRRKIEGRQGEDQGKRCTERSNLMAKGKE